MYVCLEIDDAVDVPSLRLALAALTRRHRALHTRCVRGAGPDWAGRLEPELEPEFVRHDAADLAGGRDLVMRELRRPFDLDRGALVRGVLVSLEQRDRHLFALCAHHLAVDGWSFGVMLRELGELYTAARLRTDPKLPPATQATDVIAWHRASWPAERGWWQTTLDGVRPIGFTPPGHRVTTDYVADSLDSGIDGRMSAALRAIAASHRILRLLSEAGRRSPAGDLLHDHLLRLTQGLAGADRAASPGNDLPVLLTAPPWSRLRVSARPPVIAGLGFSDRPAMAWAEGERECWARTEACWAAAPAAETW
jgi:hypothetical protein